MANKKFSQFSNVPHTATTFVVGYDGAANVRMLASSVGGSTDNISVPKGLCRYPNSYGKSPIILDSPFSNVRIRFQPSEMIQIYQDTEIQEIRLNVVIASATDEWYVGLYKYDLPNDKYVKQCQWDVSTSVAGMVSQSLGSPITINSGTYFLGVKSKDQTAEGPATNATYTSIPIVAWHTALANIATTSSQINNMQVVIAAGATVLTAEFPSSAMTYGRTSYPCYAPYLVY